MRALRLVAAAVAAALLLVATPAAAPPAWDVTGTWKSFTGLLTLTQAPDGKLTGTFAMAFGCAETYTAAGTISGSAVSLGLARANGKGDEPPCAGSQTLSGSLNAAGTAMSLVLANRFQTSPATAFAGKAKKIEATCPGAAPAIVYVAGSDLWVMAADGTGQIRCTATAAQEREPAWVPDGSKIAFATRGIWTMNADGTRAVQLTKGPSDGFPSWSPSGDRIAFQRWENGANWVYTMTAAGSGLKKLARGGHPAWSPDGSKIAYVSTAGSTGDEIWVMRANGSGQTRLTRNSAVDVAPAWSPDGSRIAFASDRDRNYEIYVMGSNGSGQTRLTTLAGRDDHPTWSPDGAWIAWSRAGSISRMKPNGSGQARLAASGLDPDWRR